MATKNQRKGLGRGLGALIPNAPERPVDVLIPDRMGNDSGGLDGGSAKELLRPRRSVSRETKSGGVQDVSRETPELLEVPGAQFKTLPLKQIVPNQAQPRQVFEQDDLQQLADSISQVGVLQPVVVRTIGKNRYELVMGERRLRASELAGLAEIPAIIREVEEQDLLRDALLENLHRVQLNPLEEAAAYQQLLDDFECTQEELSARIARSRPQIANTLRLLKLPASVQQRVAAGVLSAGHARALLSLDSEHEMEILANRIVAEGLSVRAAEEIVKLSKRPKEVTEPRVRPAASERALRVEGSLADRLDTAVSIVEGRRKGKIVISFADDQDLERISSLLLR